MDVGQLIIVGVTDRYRLCQGFVIIELPDVAFFNSFHRPFFVLVGINFLHRIIHTRIAFAIHKIPCKVFVRDGMGGGQMHAVVVGRFHRGGHNEHTRYGNNDFIVVNFLCCGNFQRGQQFTRFGIHRRLLFGRQMGNVPHTEQQFLGHFLFKVFQPNLRLNVTLCIVSRRDIIGDFAIPTLFYLKIHFIHVHTLVILAVACIVGFSDVACVHNIIDNDLGQQRMFVPELVKLKRL